LHWLPKQTKPSRSRRNEKSSKEIFSTAKV
jgi:hypothetical protein